LIKKYFLLLLFSFNGFAQAITLPELQAKLTSHQLIRGQYQQVKKMQMFKQPLLSEGDFLLDQQQGLLWRQKQPFPVFLTLTKDRLSQRYSDQPAHIIEAVENPMVFYFSHLFLSLFKGDIEGLTVQFDMHLESKNGQWLLLLTPKISPLNKVFKKITIIGSEYIDQLNLLELNGDSSTIQFLGQNNLPAKLTDNEQQYFQF
tara:strand:+ start:11970 stop:12575 length:606 start_codon:yes stop_codon:yes gene_type:complete